MSFFKKVNIRIMKKQTLLISMLLLFGNLYSQIHVINVRNVQSFEHPIMETNLAIKADKVIYKGASTADSKYIFDLNKMKLFRNMDGLEGEFDIIEIKSDESILNVWVKFPNEVLANYIYQKEDENSRTLFCRWTENDKVIGWFDKTL